MAASLSLLPPPRRVAENSNLTLLLARSVSASDIGSWAKGRTGKVELGECIFAKMPSEQFGEQDVAVPESPAVLRPGSAILAARKRISRPIGSRPSSANPSIEKRVLEHVANELQAEEQKGKMVGPRPQTAPAARKPFLPETEADAKAARHARILYGECVQNSVPLTERLDFVVALLEALPLLHGASKFALHALALRAELRTGERYQRLYKAGTENTDGGYAYVILCGEAEACEEGGRARTESSKSRVDRFCAGMLCGAELLAAPSRPRPADPTVPRTQTCSWTLAGTALALPLSALAAAPLHPGALRKLHCKLCAQLLLPLLPEVRQAKAPEWASLVQLASQASLRRHEGGELLYGAGDSSDTLRFLVRGAVDVIEPLPMQKEAPSLDGRRLSCSNRRSSRSNLGAAASSKKVHLRTVPGPLDGHCVVAETPWEMSVRVALPIAHKEHSALVLSLPAAHARLVLRGHPTLRTALLHHSHAATLQTVRKSDAPQPVIGGGRGGGGVPRPATAATTHPSSWHRSRAADQAHTAFTQVPKGARPHRDDPPWTFLISQIDGFDGAKNRGANRGASGGGMGGMGTAPPLPMSASTPYLKGPHPTGEAVMRRVASRA